MGKKIFVPVLFVLALIIWSHNIYSIFIGVKQNDEDISLESSHDKWNSPDTSLVDSSEKQTFIYKAKYRDPFQNWLEKPVKKSTRRNLHFSAGKKKNKINIPELHFTGVLRDSSGILAIIEDSTGKAYFVKEKSIVAGVSILHITSNSVECQVKKKKFLLHLNKNNGIKN